MKYIKNRFFDGTRHINDFEGTKAYFVDGEKEILVDKEELPKFKEYIAELEAAESMEEQCEILNRETDTYGNGTRYEVWEV